MAQNLNSNWTTKHLDRPQNGNETYQSRLTRWEDRLLKFEFTVQHTPGKNMGFADYFSRYPVLPALKPRESDKNYVVNLIDSFKHILNNAQRISTDKNATKSQNHARTMSQNIESKAQQTHELLAIIVVQISHSLLALYKIPN